MVAGARQYGAVCCMSSDVDRTGRLLKNQAGFAVGRNKAPVQEFSTMHEDQRSSKSLYKVTQEAQDSSTRVFA